MNTTDDVIELLEDEPVGFSLSSFFDYIFGGLNNDDFDLPVI
jgi:hypothetical protein